MNATPFRFLPSDVSTASVVCCLGLVSEPDRAFAPAIDWGAGFSAALDAVNESILSPALSADWERLAPHVRTLAPEQRRSLLLPVAYRCWNGERQCITHADLLSALRADESIPTHIRKDLDGEIDEVGVRSVTIDDVLVDTGATLLCLPSDVVASLGLRMLDEVPIETAKGPGTARLFRNALLDVAGRRATVDVLELPKGTTPLLGVTPMEILGIEPDLQNRRLRLLPREPNNTYIIVL